MQAGASVKGEFEKRLKSVIDEVQASETPIILFIDEAHTLIGAGGAAGTGDAANLLKPALARGELRTIAATTWAEYKKHIEKDPALTRRFQVVQVEEPSEAAAVLMMRGIAGVLEKHHRGADPRRGDRGGGRPLAPLHPGAPAARQGGQPARHRLRPRRDQPARDAGRGRGHAAGASSAGGRARHHRARGGDRHRRRRAQARVDAGSSPRPKTRTRGRRGALGAREGAGRARFSSSARGSAASGVALDAVGSRRRAPHGPQPRRTARTPRTRREAAAGGDAATRAARRRSLPEPISPGCAN